LESWCSTGNLIRIAEGTHGADADEHDNGQDAESG
jgi:hypothetical protein